MTSTSLMNAILSLDAYNRSYDAGITLSGNALGNIVIQRDSLELGYKEVNGELVLENGEPVRIDEDVSFYGIAYTYNGTTQDGLVNGQTIISYRGTDNLANDFLTGWPGGLGASSTAQSELAVDFFQSIINQLGLPTTQNSETSPYNLSITGHSLGGGLAAYIAGLYGYDATVFDSMAFENAVNGAYANSNDYFVSYTDDQNNEYFDVRMSAQQYYDLLQNEDYTFQSAELVDAALRTDLYGLETPWQPDLSGIKGFSLDGQFLNFNLWGTSIDNPKLDLGTDITDIWDIGPIDRHDASTLAIRLFANEYYDIETQQTGSADWLNAGQYFWKVFYQNDFAQSLDLSQIQGRYIDEALLGNEDRYSQIVRNALAYSALDSGTLLFGDTGIRALYHDANTFGGALTGATNDNVMHAYGEEISKAFVEFAGSLAINKIESIDSPEVLYGVLSHNSTNHTLTIKYYDALWETAGKDVGDIIVSRENIVEKALGTDEVILRNAMWDLWQDDTNTYFDKIIFSTVEHSLTVAEYEAAKHHTLFIANGNDSGYQSRTEVDDNDNFMIIGSDAKDIIIGGSGDSIISGGAGDDEITGGSGKNIIFGGAGDDRLEFASGDNIVHGGDDNDKIFIWGGVKGSYLGEGDDDTFYTGYGSINYWNFYTNTRTSSYLMDAVADGGADTDTLKITNTGYLELTGNATTFKFWDGVADQYVTFQNIEELDVDVAYAPVVTVMAANAANGNLNFESYDLSTVTGYNELISFDYSQRQSSLDFTGLISNGKDFLSISGGGLSHSLYNLEGLTVRGTNHGDSADELKDIIFISGYGDDNVSTLSGNVTYVYNGGDDVVETNTDTTLILRVAANVSYDDVADWSWSNISLNSTDNYYYGDFHLLFDNGDTLSVEGQRLYFDGQSPIYSMQVVFEDVLKSVTFKHDDTYTETTYTQSTVNAGTWGNDNFTAVDAIGGEYSALGGNDVFTGSDVTDIAYMGEGDDTADGCAGNDYLFGQKGNDTLTGGTGTDFLDGGEGNDTLTGGLGDDELRGGYGDDVYIYNAGDGTDEITEYLNEGFDKLYIYGYTETQLNFIGLGNDFIVELLDGTDLITFTQGGISGGYSDITHRIEEIYLNDVLLFGGGYAFPGNTTLTGSSSGDTLFGGEGYNLIEAGAGNDTVYGNGGNDELFGEDDNDTIYGDDGDDYLDGGDGDDVLTGGAGDDEIYGGDGADIISGGTGSDTLVGGKGDDIYKYAQGDGVVSIIGNEGDGSNTLWLTDLNVADIRLVPQFYISGEGPVYGLYIQSLLDSNDVINIISSADNTNLAYYDLFLNAVSTIRFADDTVWDLTQGLTIDADGWVDLSLTGSSGNDIIYGSTGSDSLYGREGNDELYGVTGGEDYLVGGEGDDTYYLGDTDTHVLDQVGNSTIYSGAGVNLIEVAQNSSNIIHTGYGEDTLVGYGVGTFPNAASTIYLHNYDKIDLTYTLTAYDFTVKTLAGDTLLTFMTAGQTYTNLTFRFDGEEQNGYTLSDLALMPTNGDNSLNYTPSLNGINIDLLDGDDYITGSNFDDVIIGGAGNDVIYGQYGNDVINGGEGDDILDGIIGNNTYVFDTNFGNDTIQYFVPGNDKIDLSAFTGITLLSQLQIDDVNGDAVITLPGETGSITVLGRGSHDWNGGNFIWSDGSNGNNNIPTQYDDSLLGTESGDVIYALNGNDTVHALTGNDYVAGGQGNDVLYGDDGEDKLYGDAGNDTLYGGAGNDAHLDGGIGDDYVYGEDGDDTIYVSQGSDILDGGNGVDTLHFTNGGYASIVVNLADNLIYNDGWGGQDSVSNFENVWVESGYDADVTGNDQDNAIYTNYLNDTIHGRGGNDYLSGAGGNDVIYGDDGNDEIHGDQGDDQLYGGAGNDSFYGEYGADSFDGGAGEDAIIFGPYGDQQVSIDLSVNSVTNDGYGFADTIYNVENIFSSNSYGALIKGNSSYNYISLSEGDNEITVTSGGDYIFLGSSGTDTVKINSEFGTLTIDNFISGQDKIDLTDFAVLGGWSDISTTQSGNNTTVYFVGTSSSITLWNFTQGVVETDFIFAASSAPTENGEIIYGTEGADTIDSLGGNDTIYGLGGNDILYDGEGSDSVYGQEGDDTIILEAGEDFADGGDGIDNIYDYDFENDVILGGAGWDFIGVGGGSDFYDGGSDTDALVFNTGSQQINVDLSAGIISNDGYGYVDTITNFENIYSHSTFGAQIKGDSSHNYVKVTQGDNTILVTSGGDEIVLESNGADTLKVNSEFGTMTVENFVVGQDKIDFTEFSSVAGWVEVTQTQSGNDTIISFANSSSTITLYNFTAGALQSTDVLFGVFPTNGDDILTGTEGADTIDALQGNDTIYGLGGDDTLKGGEGSDIIFGGDGNDYIYGSNTLLEGPGFVNGSNTLYGEAGNDSIYLGKGNDYAYGGSGVDNFYDTDGNDYIDGGDDGDYIYVGAGYDLYEGGSGFDAIVFNGDGTYGCNQRAFINLENGYLLNDGFGYFDSVNSIERVFVNSIYGADIRGSSAYNEFYLNSGDNNLVVSSGGDVVFLNSSGTTTFSIESDFGTLTINDFDLGQDSFDLTLFQNVQGWSDVSINQTGGNTYISFANSTSVITLSGFTSTLQSTDFQFGTFGTSGDDYIEGTSGDDYIYGLGGSDQIYGYAGDDWLEGGDQIDWVYGGEGNDTVKGNDGDDIISGQQGNDTLYGGNGADYLWGNEGVDFLYGDADADALRGMEGNDYLFGGAGNDNLKGDDVDSDPNFVGAGNDRLYGEAGNDNLSGGAGNDILVGGAGQDIMNGDAGSDTFLYAASDIDGSRDYIYGFEAGMGGDTINLADVLQYDSLTDTLSDFVFLVQGGSYTRINIDIDGSGTNYGVQAVAQLQNVTGLNLTDMVNNGNLVAE